MTYEQFYYWLKGFLTNDRVLTPSELKLIKETIEQVNTNNNSQLTFPTLTLPSGPNPPFTVS